MTDIQALSSIRKMIFLFKKSFNSEGQNFTTGSLRSAIVLLAIPMVLEMLMESLFAVVDIFFVGKLGKEAVTTVGLTESMLTIVYSVAIGVSMAATATVARRVGEQNHEAAAHSGAQALIIGASISILISLLGLFFAKNLLALMGASSAVIATGSTYTQIALGGNLVVMLLFLINGIFRGAGDASVAMKSLWIANICNIIFCPLFIMVLNLGVTGAAWATLLGRSIGVLYQLHQLFKGKGILKFKLRHFIPEKQLLQSIINIASTGTLQFLIASGSWIFMVKIIAGFGEYAIAGYTVAIRLVIFFIMPAWGLSNAAATLVGQNLGAKLPERAEKSVWLTARYSAFFMAFVTAFFWFGADWVVGFMNKDPLVAPIAVNALKTMSLGYIFYGIGMVMMNAFNGAGDTKTPTWINLFGFWAFQIPLAWLLAKPLGLGYQGVFIAILIAETAIALAGIIYFKRGKWKTVQV
jgi:putative MATE family efflux protein